MFETIVQLLFYGLLAVWFLIPQLRSLFLELAIGVSAAILAILLLV